MCQGFGIIIDKDINLWFSEPDTDGNCSHSIIIERLGWRENEDPHLRSFVRVEFADWTPESFTFDETTTLPGWCENNKQEIQNKCVALLEKCAPAWAEYEKVCDPAWAEYEKVRALAYAEYEKVCDPAWAEYEKVRYPAWAEYEKVCDQARADTITRLKMISGYVGCKEVCRTPKPAVSKI